MLRQLMKQGLAGPDSYVQRTEDMTPRPLRDFDPHSLQLLPHFLPPLPPPPEPPPPPPAWRSWQYFPKHWSGTLPPHLTLGLSAVPPMVLLALVLAAGQLRDLGAQGRWVAAGLALFLLVLLGTLFWYAVGCKRCLAKLAQAPAPAPKRQRQLLNAATMLIVALTLLVSLPLGWDWLRIAVGHDPQGQYQTTVDATQKILRIQGRIGYGLQERLIWQLQRTPDLRIVQLELNGGRVAEAQRLAAVVHARKLATYVEQYCSGPCTTVYVAGNQRLLGPKAQLAFHRYADPRQPSRTLYAAQSFDNSFFQSQGVLFGVTLKMFDLPPEQPWIPSHKILLDARVADLVAEADEVQLAVAAPAQFEVLHHPVMRVLKTLAPERYAALAQDLRHAEGAQAEPVVAATLLTLETLVRQQARSAPDAPLHAYVQSLIAQARAVQTDDPALCYRILFDVGNEAALHARISSFALFEHRQRAAAVVEASLQSPVTEVVTGGRGVQVFRMALTKKIDEDIDVLGTPRAEQLSPERRCEAAITYFDNALRMPQEYRYGLLRSLL